MNFNIIPTPPFEKDLKHLAKKYPSIKKDIADLVNKLMEYPNWELLLAMIVIK